eukprot:TRINITY_DN2924_c0_g1_i2.p1 TRINITY_DN2924_c0_g1~~TRINITY_DN2924_c0_g1_i2.p1  ORF type:complete len:654 (-),score=128.04 TRINITY_DN2924_c0_g1_i2:1306-3267(-)
MSDDFQKNYADSFRNESSPLLNDADEPLDEDWTGEPVAPINEEEATKKGEQQELLSFWTKILYAFPNFTFSIGWNISTVYISHYYATYQNLSLNQINMAIMIDSMFLIFAFPILGWLSDKTHTRWGRRRPWILGAAPFFFIFSSVLFTPPDHWGALENHVSHQNLTFIYLLVINLLYVLTGYMIQTPYSALGVELSLNFDERSSIFSFTQGFYMLGVILSTGGPEFGLTYVKDQQELFFLITAVNGILGILSIIVLCFMIKERPEFSENKTTPLVSGMKASFFKNKPFIYLVVSVTILNSAPGVLSLMPFWTQYTLQASDFWSSIIMITFIASSFLGIPFWSLISKKFGKRKAYGFSIGASVVATACLAIPRQGQIWLAIGLAAFAGMNGIFLTNSNFLYQSLQGDVVDYDEFRTGLRREATFTNIMQFCNWFMNALSTTAPFVILNLIGFQNVKTQTEEVNFGISLLVASPAIFFLVAGLVLIKYPISKQKYYAILDGIKMHKQGMPAVDPLTKEIISPPVTSGEEFDTFWLLYTFPRSFLRKAMTNKASLQYFPVGMIVLGIVIAVVFGFLWHQFPTYYYVTGYILMGGVCLSAFYILHLVAARQVLKDRAIDRDAIASFLGIRSSRSSRSSSRTSSRTFSARNSTTVTIQ